MKRPTPRYLAAASLLAALVWFFIPSANSKALALDELIDAPSRHACSIRDRSEDRYGNPPNLQNDVSALGKYRMEWSVGGNVNITDFEGAKMLTLIPATKQAIVFNLKNMPKDKPVDNYFETVRRLLRDQRDKLPAYKSLGEKTIDGRKATGFRLESATGTVTLWGDPKTGYPIRIENLTSGVPKTEVVMTKFEMNVDLPAELFTTTVPKDYQVKSFDMDASQPKESDLVESFRAYAAMSNGTFPDSLDTQSVMKVVIGMVLKGQQGDWRRRIWNCA